MLQVLKKSEGPSLLVTGQAFYDQFLKPGVATMQGALSAVAEKLAAELQAGAITPATLQEIEVAALNFMSREILPGFRNSDEFQTHTLVQRTHPPTHPVSTAIVINQISYFALSCRAVARKHWRLRQRRQL